MITRLRTSKDTKERMESLNRLVRFSNNAVLLRYAIARSLLAGGDVTEDIDARPLDSLGFEIPRSTLFGENEAIFKYSMGIKQSDSDDLFFPTLTLMHIERGIKLLERDYKYAGNKEKFIRNLINKINDPS